MFGGMWCVCNIIIGDVRCCVIVKCVSVSGVFSVGVDCVGVD